MVTTKTTTHTTRNLAAFQLKGSVFALTVMHLNTTDISAITAQVHKTIQQVPNFFNNAPLVLDLGQISPEDAELDFTKLITLLKHAGFIPVGIRHAHATLATKAHTAGLGNLTHDKHVHDDETTNNDAKQENERSARIIHQPVRSGQQIYAEGTDLIVLNSVSPGAELLADGNIHVYGTLRGRALAGTSGNKDARIFCKTLAAELVSVAGHYKLNPEHPTIDVAQPNSGVQIYLDEDKIIIATI